MWAKIITIKRTKDLNYFSLCALNLFNTRVSQFELNYWNKWTFPQHSNSFNLFIYLFINMCMQQSHQPTRFRTVQYIFQFRIYMFYLLHSTKYPMFKMSSAYYSCYTEGTITIKLKYKQDCVYNRSCSSHWSFPELSSFPLSLTHPFFLSFFSSPKAFLAQTSPSLLSTIFFVRTWHHPQTSGLSFSIYSTNALDIWSFLWNITAAVPGLKHIHMLNWDRSLWSWILRER